MGQRHPALSDTCVQPCFASSRIEGSFFEVNTWDGLTDRRPRKRNVFSGTRRFGPVDPDRATPWPLRAARARGVGVPRAAVLFRMARPEGAVQADRCRRLLGHYSATSQHGRVHAFFWAAGEIAFGRFAVPGVLFLSPGSLDVFFDGADNGDERSGGKPASDYKSVFSADNSTAFERDVWPRGFCDCVRGVAGDGAGIRIKTGGAGDLAAVLVVAGAGDGAGSGVVAFGVECAVPRREVCDALSGAILDVGVARGVSEQPGASEVALAVRVESDGWGDRRISVGIDWARAAAGRVDAGLRGGGGGAAGWRVGVLPENGRDGR